MQYQRACALSVQLENQVQVVAHQVGVTSAVYWCDSRLANFLVGTIKLLNLVLTVSGVHSLCLHH